MTAPIKTIRWLIFAIGILVCLIVLLLIGTLWHSLDLYYSSWQMLLFESPLRIEAVGHPITGAIDFVLPKGLYRCSIYIVVPEPLSEFAKSDLLFSYTWGFRSPVKIKNAGKTTVSFTSQELLDICRTSKPMDGRDGLALPYPWTNLFPGHDDRCAVFSVADLEVPDPGMCGYLTVTLENPDDVPAELNEVYWALRLERFLDAI